MIQNSTENLSSPELSIRLKQWQTKKGGGGDQIFQAMQGLFVCMTLVGTGLASWYHTVTTDDSQAFDRHPAGCKKPLILSLFLKKNISSLMKSVGEHKSSCALMYH